MTTLADLGAGDAFVLLARVAALDPVAGMTLTFFGPDRSPQGQMAISPAGVLTGQLANAAAQTPVQLARQFRAIGIGTVLVSRTTGETSVVRQVHLQPDGTFQWASSMQAGAPFYTVDDWQAVGTVTLQ